MIDFDRTNLISFYELKNKIRFIKSIKVNLFLF